MKQTYGIEQRRSIYRIAINKFGPAAQVEMAVEECAELIDAIKKRDRGRVTKSAVCEEVADVEIMMEQMRLILGDEEIDSIKEKKVARLARSLEDILPANSSKKHIFLGVE